MLEKMKGSDQKLNSRMIWIIVMFAFIGWTICGMIMGIGLATTTEMNAIIIHALLVPVVFSAVSWSYFKKFNYTTPLQTAGYFVTFVILMDFFVVSVLIIGNFDMFKSVLGTWIVFLEIFVVTYMVGTYSNTRPVIARSGLPKLQVN